MYFINEEKDMILELTENGIQRYSVASFGVPIEQSPVRIMPPTAPIKVKVSGRSGGGRKKL